MLSFCENRTADVVHTCLLLFKRRKKHFFDIFVETVSKRQGSGQHLRVGVSSHASCGVLIGLHHFPLLTSCGPPILLSALLPVLSPNFQLLLHHEHTSTASALIGSHNLLHFSKLGKHVHIFDIHCKYLDPLDY